MKDVKEKALYLKAKAPQNSKEQQKTNKKRCKQERL